MASPQLRKFFPDEKTVAGYLEAYSSLVGLPLDELEKKVIAAVAKNFANQAIPDDRIQMRVRLDLADLELRQKTEGKPPLSSRMLDCFMEILPEALSLLGVEKIYKVSSSSDDEEK